MAKSWFQVCKTAEQMHLDRDKYVYLYGAKGVYLTKSRIWDYMDMEPQHFSKFSDQEKQEIVVNSVSKTAFDCSGFACYCTGETGYSTEIFNKRTKETSLTDGVAGQFLYTTWGGTGRHIGLDAPGYGFQLDMGWESTNANIAKKKDSVHLARIKDVAWEHSFQTAAVNYDGSYATDPNANPSPAPTPGPVPAVGNIVVCNCEAANLRNGPGRQYSLHDIDRGDGKGVRHVLYKGEVAGFIGVWGNWYRLVIVNPETGMYWYPYICKDYARQF